MVVQRHRRPDAISDIRYAEAFFYISKVSWSDRFWGWAHEKMFTSYPPKTNAVLEGRQFVLSQSKRFNYVVTSTEAHVPILLCEKPRQFGTYEEPKYYVLEPPRQSSLLRGQIDMVIKALVEPLIRDYEEVSVDKMYQLAKAGSTAKWVANKMAGKYDG